MSAPGIHAVDLRRDGAVATISISGTGPWATEPAASLVACAAGLPADPSVRVVVIESDGADFCTGWDVAALAGAAGGPRSAAGRIEARWRDVRRAQAELQSLADLPLPVIAAIGGSCLGPGLELALAADLRIGADDATFGFPGAGVGLPVMAGGDLRLVGEVGSGWAKWLALSGRPIGAEQAGRIGILQQVVGRSELATTVAELASRIAANAPLAVRGIKRTVGFWSTLGLEEGLRYEAMGASVCLVSDDLRLAATAAAAGTQPSFEGT